MCLGYLKKNRNWALWLSGFFGMGALTNLVLATINLYLLRFVIHGAIAYMFLHYWGKAQRKKKR